MQGFQNCSSTLSLGALMDGNYQVAVRAVDLAGNSDPSPANFSWTISTVLPRARITLAPLTYSNATSVNACVPALGAPAGPRGAGKLVAGLELPASKLGRVGPTEAVLCIGGTAGARSCQGVPKAPLPDGAYVFLVRAASAWNEGGIDNASARAAFFVDRTPPMPPSSSAPCHRRSNRSRTTHRVPLRNGHLPVPPQAALSPTCLLPPTPPPSPPASPRLPLGQQGIPPVRRRPSRWLRGAPTAPARSCSPRCQMACTHGPWMRQTGRATKLAA